MILLSGVISETVFIFFLKYYCNIFLLPSLITKTGYSPPMEGCLRQSRRRGGLLRFFFFFILILGPVFKNYKILQIFHDHHHVV